MGGGGGGGQGEDGVRDMFFQKKNVSCFPSIISKRHIPSLMYSLAVRLAAQSRREAEKRRAKEEENKGQARELKKQARRHRFFPFFMCFFVFRSTNFIDNH